MGIFLEKDRNSFSWSAFNPVVPIRFHERRKFTANSYETTLDG